MVPDCPRVPRGYLTHAKLCSEAATNGRELHCKDSSCGSTGSSSGCGCGPCEVVRKSSTAAAPQSRSRGQRWGRGGGGPASSPAPPPPPPCPLTHPPSSSPRTARKGDSGARGGGVCGVEKGWRVCMHTCACVRWRVAHHVGTRFHWDSYEPPSQPEQGFPAGLHSAASRPSLLARAHLHNHG